MEKQIFEIISKNHPDQDSFTKEKSSREIESHVMEFIEWYTGHNSNIKEDYQYWLTNVKQ